MYSIGIDIGGMSIKIGLVDDNGNILKKSVIKTTGSVDDIVYNIAEQINEILASCNIEEKDLLGIGVGCPGAVSSKEGVIDYMPNLSWSNVPLVDLLKKFFNTKIVISNDANVAALAEAKYGVSKDVDNSIMFTLGTGVGGGIIIDRKLYEGLGSKGAELGHVTLFLGGKPCSCGRNGCVECYVSATALIGQTKEAMIDDPNSLMWGLVDNNIENVNGETAFKGEKLGDLTAKKVVDNYIMYLSESMMNMFNVFRPDMFVIGGGISNQGESLIEKIRDYCEKFDYGYKKAPRPLIKIAKFKNDAGIIGASALIK